MRRGIRYAVLAAFLIVGFAAGFPLGKSSGFSAGSEWAFVQAAILAREAGVFMPVNYEAGNFRILLKQPKHLSTRAGMLADEHEQAMAYQNSGDRTLNERVQLIRNAALQQ